MRRRPRLLSELRLVFGAALLGAGVGLAVAVLALPPTSPGFPTSPWLSRWVRALAPGVGFGWWAGLLMAIALAVLARRYEPPAPLATLTTAVRVAAVIALAAAALARILGQLLPWGLLGGLMAATLAARTWVALATRRQRP